MNVDLQAALIQDLLAVPALVAMVTDYDAINNITHNRIYDNIPDKTLYPIIQIGNLSWTDLGDKSTRGNEWTVPIHFWSQQRGKREVEKMMAMVYNRWHEREAFYVSGITVTMMRQTFGNISTENDNLTRHGIANYRVITYGA